jgi:hypothetical protein
LYLPRFAPGAPSAGDSVDGIDNSYGYLISDIVRAGISTKLINATGAVERGESSLVIQVSGWNGTPEDPRVTVGVISTFGMDPAGGRTMPAFDGQDLWQLDADGTIGAVGGPSAIAKASDKEAFVTGGLLVMRIGSATVRLGSGRIPLDDGRAAMKIVRDGASYRLTEGVMTARYSATALLTSFQFLKDPARVKPGVCVGSPSFDLARPLVCNRLDVMRAADSIGVPEKCDAMSAAFRLDSGQFKMGKAIVIPPDIPPCGLNYVATCND